MEQIADLIANITAIKIMDIVIAVAIILFFRVFSSGIAYGIIRLFKWKKAKANRIKDSAFYHPLRIFISILGVYLAILFLKKPLCLDDIVMMIVTKAFRIISTIVFAKGLAQSFTTQSTLAKKLQEKMNRDPEDSSFIFILKVARVIIYIVAGFIVITELGINLNGLVAGLGIGGVIVTLAAQDTAKNLFGGLMIFLDKPFIVGDWIQMDNYEGTVEDISFRSTRIRTFENSLVNVPNSIITNSSIINWSRMEKRRYKTNLVLELDTPLEKVNRVVDRIREMLKQHDDVIDDSIIVKFDNITENGINLLIYSYTNSVDYATFLEEKQKINYKIIQILREENVYLAYDTKTVHVKN
jgi:MscS family membrane protein